MVKSLSASDKEAIKLALHEAKKRTSAELASVVSNTSDSYIGFLLLYGMLLGSSLDLALWVSDTLTNFPALLAIQIGFITLLLLPPFKCAALRLVPLHILRHRAAHRAFEEYLRVSHHVPAMTPFMLLYVSLTERYVHILPSKHLREKIPNSEWEIIVQDFTNTLPKRGLKIASISALEQIAKKLSEYFPA